MEQSPPRGSLRGEADATRLRRPAGPGPAAATLAPIVPKPENHATLDRVLDAVEAATEKRARLDLDGPHPPRGIRGLLVKTGLARPLGRVYDRARLSLGGDALYSGAVRARDHGRYLAAAELFADAERTYRDEKRDATYVQASRKMRGWCLSKAGLVELALPVLEGCLATSEAGLDAVDDATVWLVRTLLGTIEKVTPPGPEGTLLRIVQEANGDLNGSKEQVTLYLRALVAVKAELDMIDGRPNLTWRNRAGDSLVFVARPDAGAQRALMAAWATWHRAHERAVEVVDNIDG